jgi:hypothetical protein
LFAGRYFTAKPPVMPQPAALPYRLKTMLHLCSEGAASYGGCRTDSEGSLGYCLHPPVRPGQAYARLIRPQAAILRQWNRPVYWLGCFMGDIAQPRSGRQLINESRYPYVVELAVPDTGLEIELNRQIVGFHKSRRIEPRHGRRTMRDNQTYSRWCFSDLPTARVFAEQFGGAFYKTTGS